MGVHPSWPGALTCSPFPPSSPQNNKLSGVLPSYANNPVLHIVHLDNNQFTGHLRATNYSALFTGGLITDLSVSSNR